MSRRLPYAPEVPPVVGTEHLPLFAQPEGPARPVHHDDPPAAKRGALAHRRHAAAQRTEVWVTVDAAGVHGLVHTEVDEIRNWPGGTANRRLCELVARKELCRLAEQRLTKHNAWAHIYVSPRHLAGREVTE